VTAGCNIELTEMATADELEDCTGEVQTAGEGLDVAGICPGRPLGGRTGRLGGVLPGWLIGDLIDWVEVTWLVELWLVTVSGFLNESAPKTLGGIEAGWTAGVETEGIAGVETEGIAGVETGWIAGVETGWIAGVETGWIAGVETGWIAGVETGWIAGVDI
jgi:hypothetical protein